MPNISVTEADTRLADHHARVDRLDRMGPHYDALRVPSSPKRRPILGDARSVLAVVCRRLVLSTADSRDRLRAKEEDLAMLGLTWPSDAEYDRILADEIRANQLVRHSPETLGLPMASRDREKTSGGHTARSARPSPSVT
jgi:hypothetical protein